MCWFSVLAVTAEHKRHGSKQHRFFVLYFWKSEVSNPFYQVKVKMLAGLFPSEGSEGRIGFLALPQIPGPSAFLGSWPLHPSSKPAAGVITFHYLSCFLPLSHDLCLFCSQICLCLPLIRTLVMTFRIHPENPE